MKSPTAQPRRRGRFAEVPEGLWRFVDEPRAVRPEPRWGGLYQTYVPAASSAADAAEDDAEPDEEERG